MMRSNTAYYDNDVNDKDGVSHKNDMNNVFYFYQSPKFTSTSRAEDIVTVFPIFRQYSEELRLKTSLILL